MLSGAANTVLVVGSDSGGEHIAGGKTLLSVATELRRFTALSMTHIFHQDIAILVVHFPSEPRRRVKCLVKLHTHAMIEVDTANTRWCHMISLSRCAHQCNRLGMTEMRNVDFQNLYSDHRRFPILI